MKIILIWQSSRSSWWLRKHMPESPPDWWLWQWPARDTLPILQVMVRKNCIACSVFSISLGETWDHGGGMRAPLVCTANLAASVSPRLCSLAVSMACIWAPSCLCSGANQLVSLKEKPRHNWQSFFSGLRKEAWHELDQTLPWRSSSHPRRLHAHWTPCWAAKPKMPSDPAENHHAGRLPPSPFTT